MSKEYRNLTLGFTVKDYEDLPLDGDGDQMHADDVVDELADHLNYALKLWYAQRGHELLTSEPML